MPVTIQTETLPDYYPELGSFEEVARHYLKEHAPRLTVEMEWFGSQSLTLPKAIERACASVRENGSLHPHQRRPFQRWPEAPKQAAENLKPLAIRIAETRNFDDDLYPIVSAALAQVRGTGPLSHYDIARRIGAWMRPEIGADPSLFA